MTIIEFDFDSSVIQYSGISANNKTNILIKNLKVSKFNYGIYFVNVDNSIIENVSVENCKDVNIAAGIYIKGSDSNSIINSKISQNYNGIIIINSSNNFIYNNTVNFSRNGLRISSSSENTIYQNLLNSNDYGITQSSCSNNEFIFNSISNNSICGITESYSSNNRYSLNDIKYNNGYQIRLYSTSDSTIYYKNNILTSNSFPDSAIFNETTGALNLKNNYWGTSDSKIIFQQIKSFGGNVNWQPYSLTEIDTLPGADTLAPADVVIEADNSLRSAAIIKWSKPVFDESGNPLGAGDDKIAGYRLYRAQSAECRVNGDTDNWEAYLLCILPSALETSIIDTNIIIGETYFYRVVAYDKHTTNGKQYYNCSWYSNILKYSYNYTPFFVATPLYADSPTFSINSRNILLSGSIGYSGMTNKLYVYNSESKETSVFTYSDTTEFRQNINFQSDGFKTIILTAIIENNLFEKSIIKLHFNIDITPPVIKVFSPFNKQIFTDTLVSVKGSLDHTFKYDTAKIIVNGGLQYPVNFDKSDSKIFYCSFPISVSQYEDTFIIIAADYIGNTSVRVLCVFYKNDTANIETIISDADMPDISLNTDKSLYNILLSSLNKTTAPNPLKLTIRGENNMVITLQIEFSDTSYPVSLVLKNAFDIDISNRIAVSYESVNSVKKYGNDEDYNFCLKTVRSFNFLRNDVFFNDASCFKKINFNIVLPDYFKKNNIELYSLYLFNEQTNRWEIADCPITRNQSNFSISAELKHFSIYGIFSSGVPQQQNLSQIAIFPNPFRPNDNDIQTGSEFTGTPNASNLTGIHIDGLTANTVIEIYTLRGELIANLNTLPNQGMAIWDATTTGGQKAASGTYIVLIKNNNEKIIRKLTIIR